MKTEDIIKRDKARENKCYCYRCEAMRSGCFDNLPYTIIERKGGTRIRVPSLKE
jgi:hypothetical protein